MQHKIDKHVCFLLAIILLSIIVFNSCKKNQDKIPNSGTLPSIPIDSINSKLNITAKLVDSSGKPLSNVFYTIKAPSDQDTLLYQGGFTDTSGNITDRNLHVRTAYTLNVYQYNFCGTAFYSKNFTTPNTLQTNVSLGNLVIEPVSTIITGAVVDCNNNPLKNGTVTVEVDIKNSDPNNSNLIILQQYHSSINPDGSFKLRFPVCSKTDSVPATIYVEDATGLQVGNQVCYSIHYPESDIGKIQGCNSIDTVQFFNYTIDSTHYSLYSPDHVIENPGDLSTTYIVAPNQSIGTIADFRISGFLAVGKSALKLTQFEIGQNVSFQTYDPTAIINITEYGPIGGFIAGNIKGQIENLLDQTIHVATCSFRVKRKQ